MHVAMRLAAARAIVAHVLGYRTYHIAPRVKDKDAS
jgi:hypothetical protein